MAKSFLHRYVYHLKTTDAISKIGRDGVGALIVIGNHLGWQNPVGEIKNADLKVLLKIKSENKFFELRKVLNSSGYLKITSQGTRKDPVYELLIY